MSLHTANQKAHCVGRPGQSWTSSVEVKPLAGPLEGSLVRPSLRTAFFTRILQEGPSAVARTSHPLGIQSPPQHEPPTSPALSHSTLMYIICILKKLEYYIFRYSHFLILLIQFPYLLKLHVSFNAMLKFCVLKAF